MKWVAVLTLASLLVARTAGASNEQRCQALKQCFPGGSKENACEMSTGACPPCVDFATNACYQACSFPSWVDCSKFVSGSGGGSAPGGTSGGTTASSKPPKSSASSGSGAGTKPSGSPSDKKNATSHSGSNGSHKNAGSAGSGDGTGKSSGIFIIIGASFGIIAVAVIFLVLIRRTHAPNDDIDEMVTPAALTKAPGSSVPVQAVQYAQFAPAPARPGANPTTPTNRVVQYYKDNAMPSPRVTNHTGFGADLQAQNQAQQAPVARPPPGANAPMFFGPASTVVAAPPNQPVVYAAPTQEEPMQQQQGQAYASATYSVHVGAPAAPVPPPVPVQAPMNMPPPAQFDTYEVPGQRDTTPGVIMQMHAEHVEVAAEDCEPEQVDFGEDAYRSDRHESFEL